MRVLITSSPGYGHVLPVVTTAWALRAAGHEVMLALAGRSSAEIDMLAAAGLHVVEVAKPEAFASMAPDPKQIEQMRAVVRKMAREGMTGDAATMVAKRFGGLSDMTADAVVDLARWWQPNIVVHTPLEAAGPLAAAKLGVPAVEQAFGLSSSRDRYLVMAEAIAETYRRHGVSAPPAKHALLDVAPPSMRAGDEGWSIRYVPFNGGGQLPDWALARPSRPRVTVTLGTVVPGFGGVSALKWLADSASEVDAEFVVALGGADTSSLGKLPDNVRVVGWMPLTVLLATSAASIHHGGSGSTMASLVAGVPQLVVPHAADQFANAVAVTKRGVGFEADPEEHVIDAADLTRLLSDADLAAAAAEVKAEIAGMPAPAELVSRLVEWMD